MKKLLFALALLCLWGGTTLASSYNTVSVASSATAILAKSRGRIGWIIYNNSAVTVYIGFNSSVTTANGIAIPAGTYILDDGTSVYLGDIYGIVSSGTADLRFGEWGSGDVIN